MHSQVHLVGDALVGQVVLTGHSQPQVGAGDDFIVVLDDHVVDVTPQPVLPHVALQVVVGHAQLELQTIVHVPDARVGAALGVDLAVEDFAGLDPCHHVAGTAVDRYVVAGAQFVGGRLLHIQIGVLKNNHHAQVM